MRKVYPFRAKKAGAKKKSAHKKPQSSEAVAAQYIARLYSGELTDAEEQRLSKWRLETVENEIIFQEMLNLWDLSQHLYQPIQVRAKRKTPWFLAASLAAMAWLVSFYFQGSLSQLPEQDIKVVNTAADMKSSQLNKLSNAQANISRQEVGPENRPKRSGLDTNYFYTDVGEVKDLTLPDGTQVTLNTATVLSVSFESGKRQVSMLEGEAFFDVAKDPNRPFIIDTGTQRIQVIGTKFNVRKEEQGVKVAVVEGKVRVARVQPQVSGTVELVSQDYLLEAGVIGSFSLTAEVVAAADLERAHAAQDWRRGVFKFDDVYLAEVIKELNRYRKKKIRMADESASSLRVSGVFHVSDNSALLQALEDILPITFTDTGAEILLKKRKR